MKARVVDEVRRLNGIEESAAPPTASIKPGYSRDSTDLDTLARLMTGPGDTCTALCFDQDKLLIANNSGDANRFRRCASALRQFILSPFKAEYQALEMQALNESGANFRKPKIQQKIFNLRACRQTHF